MPALRPRDLLVTGVVLVFVLVGSYGAAMPGGRFGGWGWPQDVRPLGALGVLWLVLTVLPLVLRRIAPLPVFLLTGASALAYYLTDYPRGPLLVAPTVALFALARASNPVRAGVAAAVLWAGHTTAQVLLDRGAAVQTAAGLLVWAVAVIAVGTVVRLRGDAVTAARERHAERERRLAEQERLRIAREVHDVVAHSLAMINVQAGVGAHVADRRPEQAKEALLAIKEASRAALVDLRATLAVLRGTGERAPAPSLTDRDRLLDPVSAAGLRVEVTGEPGELPAPVDLAAYRILQESLTNAVRHAQAATAVTIRFTRTGTGLDLAVTDDGTGSVQPGSGQGLRGMRERAEALGGTLAAGPQAGGGYRVHAVLPIEGER